MSSHGYIISLPVHFTSSIIATLNTSGSIISLSLMLSKHLLLHGVVLGLSFARIIVLILFNVAFDLVSVCSYIHLLLILLLLELLHITNFFCSVDLS